MHVRYDHFLGEIQPDDSTRVNTSTRRREGGVGIPVGHGLDHNQAIVVTTNGAQLLETADWSGRCGREERGEREKRGARAGPSATAADTDKHKDTEEELANVPREIRHLVIS